MPRGFFAVLSVRWLILAVLLPAVACGRPIRERAASTGTSDGTAIVIRGSELSGNLLDAMRLRINGMSVTNSSSGCPRITFRGRRSGGNPAVYIDGTHMADTCVLMSVVAMDVDRVEVYRSGAGAPPIVQGNPNGAILVYRIRK